MNIQEHIQQAEDQGKHIEAGFRSLYAKVYPNGVSEEQYGDLRKFFFSGATFLFHKMMKQIDDDREPTEADIAFMSRISEEVIEFYETLPNG